MQESRRVYVSEEAPEPRESPRVCEQEMRSVSCQDHVAELQSQISAMELSLREVRAEKEHYKMLYLNAEAQVERMQNCLQEQNANLERRLEKLDLLKANFQEQGSSSENVQPAIGEECRDVSNWQTTPGKELEAEVENLRAEVSKLRENEKIVKEMNSDLTVKLALFESEIENKQEENKYLATQVQYLQGNVHSLKQTKEELSLYVSDMKQSVHDLKSQLAIMQQEILDDINNFLEHIRNETRELAIPEENRGKSNWETTTRTGHLLAEIQNLIGEIYKLRESDKIQNEKNRSLSDEVDLLNCQIEKKQEENICLQAEVYGLKENEKILKEKNNSLSGKLVLLESELGNKQEKNRNLCAKVHKLQEQLDSLNEVSDSTAAELDQLQCLMKRKNEDNWSLKETVRHLGYELKEVQELIRIKQEIIIKKNNEIADREQTIEELYLHVSEMRQSIYDLRSQLEQRQEEEILAGVQNSLEKFRSAENPNQVAIAMKCRHEDTVENTPEECRDSSVLETPAAQGQTERRWIRFSKKVLKAAVFGVTIVGAACLATTLHAGYYPEANSCMYDYVSEILYSHCRISQSGCHPY